MAPEKTESYSDYELFALIMGKQNAAKIDVVGERVIGTSAIVRIVTHSYQGDQELNIEFVINKGGWMIHSAGFRLSTLQ